MKRIILMLIVSLFTFWGFGQNSQDSIKQQKFGNRTLYTHNEIKILSATQFCEIIKVNPSALKEWKIGRINYNSALICAVGAGSCLGLGLSGVGTKSYTDPSAKSEINWILMGIGSGLTSALFVVFFPASKRHAKEAIHIYNSGLKQTWINNIDFKIGLSSNGIGIRMRY